MQNLNDLNKLQQMQKMQIQTVPNLESAGKPAPSKFKRFASIIWFIISIFLVVFACYTVISDNSKTTKQINANAEAILNTPEMQKYRTQEARRQREIAKQRRLRQLGIDGVTQNVEKDDLLNQQIKKQEIAEEERLESQKTQDIDYRAQLAAYNARLKEVQAEEARLRAEAEAIARAEAAAKAKAAREQAEQLRVEQEQVEEQKIQEEEQARQKAEEMARLAQEKAEKERAAKIKIAQEKAAYAAKLKAQVEARKTQKKTLQTSNSSRNDHSSAIGED